MSIALSPRTANDHQHRPRRPLLLSSEVRKSDVNGSGKVHGGSRRDYRSVGRCFRAMRTSNVQGGHAQRSVQFFFLEGRDWSRTVSVSLIKYCRGWLNESQQSLFFRSPFSAALNLYKSMSTGKEVVFISTDYIRNKQQGTSRVPDLPLRSKSNSPLFLISKTNEARKLA